MNEETNEVPEEETARVLAEVPPELLGQVADRMADFHEAENEYNEYNEQSKASKKKMDRAQEAVNRAVDALVGQQQTRPDGFPVDSPLAVAADDDAWKTVRLDDLENPSIKAGVLKVMMEHTPPITTLGELTDWQAKKADFWAKDLPGIGRAAQDSIAAATEAYWVRNPRTPTTEGE